MLFCLEIIDKAIQPHIKTKLIISVDAEILHAKKSISLIFLLLIQYNRP
jgi:hypothetical protein